MKNIIKAIKKVKKVKCPHCGKEYWLFHWFCPKFEGGGDSWL